MGKSLVQPEHVQIETTAGNWNGTHKVRWTAAAVTRTVRKLNEWDTDHEGESHWIATRTVITAKMAVVVATLKSGNIRAYKVVRSMKVTRG